MAIDRNNIVPTHAVTQASRENSSRMVGMAIFTAATINGMVNAVAVDMTRIIYRLVVDSDSFVIP